MSTQLMVAYSGEEQVLEVDEDVVVTFPNGLVGFEEWRRFVLLEDPDQAPLGILQSLDHVEVSFLVTDPRNVLADYQLDIQPLDLKELALELVEEAQVLCILTTRDSPTAVTANLLGPIIINPKRRVARQVILQDSDYSTQHPVLSAEG